MAEVDIQERRIEKFGEFTFLEGPSTRHRKEGRSKRGAITTINQAKLASNKKRKFLRPAESR